MTNPKPTDTRPISTRFITCGQSKGSLGNSTVADTFLGWLQFAGVPFALSFGHKGRFLNTEKNHQDLTVEAGKTRDLGDLAVKGVE